MYVTGLINTLWERIITAWYACIAGSGLAANNVSGANSPMLAANASPLPNNIPSSQT